MAGFRKCVAVRARWDIQDEATAGVPKYPDNEPTVEILYDDVGERWAKAMTEAFRKERAFVQDGSQYIAELWTGPDFFCAKFEARGIPTEGGDACGSVHG